MLLVDNSTLGTFIKVLAINVKTLYMHYVEKKVKQYCSSKLTLHMYDLSGEVKKIIKYYFYLLDYLDGI